MDKGNGKITGAVGKADISFVLMYLAMLIGFFCIGGLWALLSLLLLGGSLGGLAFSLDDDGSHRLRLPWSGHEVDSGVVGHIGVGIAASFVSVAAAIVLLDLDAWSVIIFTDPIRYGAVDAEGGVKSILYTLGVSIVGGYSGLRMISGVSNAMMEKMKKEVDSKLKKVKIEIDGKDKAREAEYKIMVGRSRQKKKFYEDAVESYNEAIVLHPTAAAYSFRAYSESYLPNGFLGWAKAMESIEKGLTLVEEGKTDPVVRYDLHYNQACFMALRCGAGGDLVIDAVFPEIKRALFDCKGIAPEIFKENLEHDLSEEGDLHNIEERIKAVEGLL